MKSWRKKQDRRDAELPSRANRINEALECVPLSQRILDFDTVPLTPNLTLVKQPLTQNQTPPEETAPTFEINNGPKTEALSVINVYQ